MTAWLRECLETELASGLGTATQKGIDSKTLEKWQKLVASFKQLAEAKVQLDKSAKVLADAMTEDDEEKAVRAYLRSLDPKRAAKLLREESEYNALSTVPA